MGNSLYHSNSSPPDSNAPLLVLPLSRTPAQDGTVGNPGYVFATGDLLGTIAYSLKGNHPGKRDNMITISSIASTVAVVLVDRVQAIEDPHTSYVYTFDPSHFRQIIRKETGLPTAEYVSETPVLADSVREIRGVDIPLEAGVQVFFIRPPNGTAEFAAAYDAIVTKGMAVNTSSGREREQLFESLMLKLLGDENLLIYENKERGLAHLDLTTGQWTNPASVPKLPGGLGDLRQNVTQGRRAQQTQNLPPQA